MKLKLIPAGELLMGSDASDPDAFDNEKVAGKKHLVRITRPFYLGTTEVTVGQFRQFVEKVSYKTEAERDGTGGYGWDEAKGTFGKDPKYTWRSPGFKQEDDHPVVNVSWNDAVAFCEWLGRQEGQVYRLPTEAEWEHSCRAGQATATRYWSGDDPESLATVGNVADGTARKKYPNWTYAIKAEDGFVFTAPVGSKKANAFGLYDMHGNVWEWCADWYDSDYYAKSPPTDPWNSSGAADRVIRGGSWSDNPRMCRSAARYRATPDNRSSGVGFRVARVRSSP
jgi:formylglycine-generating enzyme required for sulfatase activity